MESESLLQISETITRHMEKYSLELQQKLEDLKRAYESSYRQAIIDVRHQVTVLEARMDVLRNLDEDIQKIIQSALKH